MSYNPQEIINQIIQNNGEIIQHAYDIVPQSEKVKSQRATRGPNSKRGMDKLADIVLNDKRDLKRINSAITLEGARQYARKLGSNYVANIEDLNNDGIQDVIIRRGGENGPVVVVNGWTTTASDFPYRKEYYEAFPSREARKNYGGNMKQYFNEIVNTEYDEYGNVVSYKVPPEMQKILNSGGFKQIKPRDISAYQLFTSRIISVMFPTVANDVGITDKTLLLSVAADVWNICITTPFYAKLLGGIEQLQNLQSNPKEFKKFTNSNATKQALKEYVMTIIINFENGINDFATNAIYPVLRESIIVKNNEKLNRVQAPARTQANPNWTSNERTQPIRKHYVANPYEDYFNAVEQ